MNDKSSFPGQVKSWGAVFFCLTFITAWLCSWTHISAANALMQANPLPASNAYSNVLLNFLVRRDGSVEGYAQFDLTSNDTEDGVMVSLPYKEGSSVIVNRVAVAEVDGQGKGLNYLALPLDRTMENEKRSTGYSLKDDGKQIDIQLRVPLPAHAKRRVQVQFTKYQTLNRYSDVAFLSLQVLRESFKTRIDNLGVKIAFEQDTLPEELSDYYYFERSTLPKTVNHLQPVMFGELNALTKIPDETKFEPGNPPHCYWGGTIPAETDFQIRLIFPGVWVPLVPIDNPGQNAMSQLLKDEETYQREKIQFYEYRGKAQNATAALLILSFFLYLGLRWFYAKEDPPLRKEIRPNPPAGLSPGVISYLEAGQITAKTIVSGIYDLVRLHYLALRDHEVWRVSETTLPDENLLGDFERSLLHWVWDLMDGESRLDLGQIDDRISKGGKVNSEYLIHLRNLLDIYCVEQGLVPLPGTISPKKELVGVSFIYLLLGLALASLGRFWLPCLLLIPAGVFAFLAFGSVHFTAKGDLVNRQIKAYRNYLLDVDKYAERGRLEETFQRDFIHSVALGVNKEFLLNSRYVFPYEDLIATDFLNRYGFTKQQIVTENYLKKYGVIKARHIHSAYSYVSRQIDQNLLRWQKALVKMRFALRDEMDTLPESELNLD